MSVDHLQINITDSVYDNSTWLYETKTGTHNDVLDAIEDLNTAFETVSGLTKEGSLVSSSDTSGSDNMQWEAQNPVYGGSSYLSSTNSTSLRNDVITQLAAITNLQSYKDVAVRSYRNDLISSDGYTFGSCDPKEGLEIFVTNVLYKGSSYVEPADVDTLLADVNAAFDNIVGLEFSGIVVSTWHSSSNGIFIGSDDSSYNGVKYLTLANAITLRNAVISAMATITDIDDTNIEVEIRVAKKDAQASS
jgi:hypothetical protein